MKYVNPPAITNITPSIRSISGTSSVTINGTDLSYNPVVTIDGSAVLITSYNDNQIVVTAPAHVAGDVQVVVTTDYGTSNSVTLKYVNPPVITNISSSTGTTLGGELVTINGTDLNHNTSVSFNGTLAVINSITATQIVCTTPAHVAGNITMTIQTSYGSTTTNFTYISPPAITNITPSSRTTLGTSSVTINGTDLSYNPVVTIDGSAVLITSYNNNQIVVTAPAHVAGDVQVVVTTAYGSSNSVTLKYINPPTIISISSSTGTTIGGELVTINGTDLSYNPIVTFDGSAAIITSYNNNQIVCTTPAQTAGDAVIIIQTSYGSTTGLFNYISPPAITSISSNTGSTLGGSSVTINGTDLSYNTIVTFNGTLATINSVSNTQIVCITPAQTAGNAIITIQTTYGSTTTNFNYISPPAYSSISQSTGSTLGTTSVIIYGNNLSYNPIVTFDGSAAVITDISNSQLICTPPAHAAGNVSITITTNYGSVVASGVYTYIAPPTISSVNPITGSTNGTTSVSLSGTNLQYVSNAKFSNVSGTTSGSFSNGNYIVTAPSINSSNAPINSTIFVNSPYGPSNSIAFTYISPPTITSIVPSNISSINNKIVTINGTNLSYNPSITFNGYSATNINVINSQQIICNVPSNISISGNVNVVYTSTYGSTNFSFNYILPPNITSRTPVYVSTNGSTSVTISGTDLNNNTQVLFGSNVASITSINSNTIVCNAPSVGQSGASNLTINTTYGTYFLSNAFTYFYPPTITSIVADSTSTISNKSILINGDNLSYGIQLTINGVNVISNIIQLNNTLVKCQVPSAAQSSSGQCSVTLSTTYGSTTFNFNYILPPNITSIVPSSGSTNGTTSVTINGTDLSYNTLVMFDVSASRIISISNTQIVCIAPSRLVGNSQINISTPYGYTIYDHFLYISPPVITNIISSPNSTTNNKVIIITGTDLNYNTQVLFNGNAGIIVDSSNTQISCLLPFNIAASGSASVNLTTNYGSYTHPFNYILPPSITNIDPPIGTYQGNTLVTITGTDLSYNPMSVFFDNSAAIITSLSSTKITCLTPAHILGTASIRVVTNYGYDNNYNDNTPTNYLFSTICFPGNTPIVTDQGIVEIRKINPEKNTIRGKVIKRVTKTKTQEKYLICIEQHALGKNIPSQKTIMTQNHELLFKKQMIKAKELLNKVENVYKIKYTGEVLYNILLEEHDKMIVNNLICETLSPDNNILDFYKILDTLPIEKHADVIVKINENIKNKKQSVRIEV